MLNSALAKLKETLAKKIGKRRLLCIYNYSPRRLHITNRILHKVYLILLAPIALWNTRGKTLPNIEMDITSRCTLTCKECSHLIPHYKKMKLTVDYNTEVLLENIDLIYPFVDRILLFRILGGEPFLNENFYRIIDKLVSLDKVKYVQINTNGTIIPQGKNLTALQNKKVYVQIANYGALSTQKEALVEIFKANGIHAILDPYSPKWHAIEGFENRGYSFDAMSKIFPRCKEVECKPLFEGKVWLCPYALHGVTLNLLPDNKDQYIDLKTSTMEAFWNELERLYDVIPPDGNGFACYYCSGGSVGCAKEVPCAEQV